MARHITTENCAPDCFGCKIQTISFAPSAMPSRNMEAAAKNEAEKQLQKDLPAYARLRSEGMQPKSTKGAAALEANATSKVEVETGVIMGQRAAQKIEDAKTTVAQIQGK